MTQIDDAREAVAASLRRWWALPDESLVAEILAFKAEAAHRGDEATANELWCLRRVHTIHETFVRAFRDLKQGEFFEAWKLFEDVEGLTNQLNPHRSLLHDEFDVDLVLKRTIAFQKLYPYKMFFSPAYDIVGRECTLCGAQMTPRGGCEHIPGRLYAGEMARTHVIPGKVHHVAFVEHPAQKYSVVFPQAGDNFSYALLQYLVERLPTPYAPWRAELTKARHPHRLFGHVGKYEPCPCGSDQKYKFCCLKHKDGVLSDHMEFWFGFDVPDHLRNVVYPDHADNERRRRENAKTTTESLILTGAVMRANS